jgi:hypothetical protein
MVEIVVDRSVTTGPIAGSTKIYVDGVPFRRVSLSNGEITAEVTFVAAREGVVPPSWCATRWPSVGRRPRPFSPAHNGAPPNTYVNHRAAPS